MKLKKVTFWVIDLLGDHWSRTRTYKTAIVLNITIILAYLEYKKKLELDEEMMAIEEDIQSGDLQKISLLFHTDISPRSPKIPLRTFQHCFRPIVNETQGNHHRLDEELWPNKWFGAKLSFGQYSPVSQSGQRGLEAGDDVSFSTFSRYSYRLSASKWRGIIVL